MQTKFRKVAHGQYDVIDTATGERIGSVRKEEGTTYPVWIGGLAPSLRPTPPNDATTDERARLARRYFVREDSRTRATAALVRLATAATDRG